MTKFVDSFDATVIHFFRRDGVAMARIALFIVYFWFGLLKIIAVSPANPLVSALLAKTLPFITFHQFIVFFGVYEMLIGICFLIPRFERVAIALLVPHLITTIMPLIMLPAITWSTVFVPTLEGQYIIKNVLIIALAMGIAAHLHPFHSHEK